VKENINAFSTIISQLLSIDIKISYEDECINLLCYPPYSWDILVVTICSNTSTLKFDEIVASLLSKKIR